MTLLPRVAGCSGGVDSDTGRIATWLLGRRGWAEWVFGKEGPAARAAGGVMEGCGEMGAGSGGRERGLGFGLEGRGGGTRKHGSMEVQGVRRRGLYGISDRAWLAQRGCGEGVGGKGH